MGLFHKKEKTQQKKTGKAAVELLPVRTYDPQTGYFQLEGGGCMDLYRIVCADFTSISEDDLEYQNLQMERFYRRYDGDIKLVCLNLPENCMEQERYIRHKIDTCYDVKRQEELEIKYRELEWLEKNRQQKEYYFMLFAKDAGQMKTLAGAVQGLVSCRLLAKLSKTEKVRVLIKLMNGEQKQFTKTILQADEKTVRQYGYDPYLLSAIQPGGGIRFYPAYIRTGNCCSAVLTVYDFKSELSEHWLSPLVNIDDAMTVVDFGLADPDEITKTIERSFREQRIRYETEKADGDQIDASRRYEELVELRRAVNELGETVRLLTIRIVVSAHTLQELEQRTRDVQEIVEAAEYHCTVCLHEQKMEWQSLLLPYAAQQQLINHRAGQAVTSSVLAAGNPYNFSYLSDPFSCYMGSTPTGGSVKLSLFTKTAKRLSYNALVYGTMGSGKSTLLKKLIETNGLAGNFIRVFDPSGEYEPLVRELGGTYLSLDGSDGIINEFEIQKVDEQESSCWVQHVSKMTAIYRLRKGGQCTQNETNTYSKLLLDFYIDYGIVPPDGKITNATPVTGLSPEQYPTMSDFLGYLKHRTDTYKPSLDAEHAEIGKRFLLQLDEIKNVYENLVRNYGYLLDGHTSIRDVSGKQVIGFNLRTALRLDPAICSGVLYNALMMTWDHCVRIGGHMKELYENGQIRVEDIICSLVVVDESHHILNAQYADCVKQITVMAREMRKYFSGIVFATQLVTDNLKGDTDASDPSGKLVQDLFDLATYKIIGKQTSTCIPIMRERFPGTFTETELFRIPRLSMGEFIFSICEQNLEVKVFISEAERQLFAGGR